MLLSSRRIARSRKRKLFPEKSKNATWDDDSTTTTNLQAQQDAIRLRQILLPSTLPAAASCVAYSSSSYTTSSTQRSRNRKSGLSLEQFEAESQKLLQLLYTTEFVGKVDQRYHAQYY
jgi:hypothetical protein